MKNPIVIGLTGHMQAGKDTVGQILAETFSYQRVAFADKLKAVAIRIGWDGSKDPWEWYDNSLPSNELKPVSTLDGRKLLQELGRAIRDELGEDAWIRPIRDRIFGDYSFPMGRYVITDVRYPNEAQWIQEWAGGEIWKVVRPGYDGDTHESETLLEGIEYDHLILNSGTLEDLRQRVVDSLYQPPGS